MHARIYPPPTFGKFKHQKSQKKKKKLTLGPLLPSPQPLTPTPEKILDTRMLCISAIPSHTTTKLSILQSKFKKSAFTKDLTT